MVVYVEERQLLPVLSTEDDEHGVEEIQEFGQVMNVNKIFHTSGVGCVDSENVEGLGQEGNHCQTPDHVHVEYDLSDVVYLRRTGFFLQRIPNNCTERKINERPYDPCYSRAKSL